MKRKLFCHLKPNFLFSSLSLSLSVFFALNNKFIRVINFIVLSYDENLYLSIKKINIFGKSIELARVSFAMTKLGCAINTELMKNFNFDFFAL